MFYCIKQHDITDCGAACLATVSKQYGLFTSITKIREVDGTLLHYVVIHKITKKQVIIADPAKGIVKKSAEEFFKEWTGVLILIVPAHAFKKAKKRKSSLNASGDY